MIGKMYLEALKVGVDVGDQADPVARSSMTPMPPAEPWMRSASSYWILLAVIMGSGQVSCDLPSRLLICCHRSCKSRFLRIASFFRRVALTRKPLCWK